MTRSGLDRSQAQENRDLERAMAESTRKAPSEKTNRKGKNKTSVGEQEAEQEEAEDEAEDEAEQPTPDQPDQATDTQSKRAGSFSTATSAISSKRPRTNHQPPEAPEALCSPGNEENEENGENEEDEENEENEENATPTNPTNPTNPTDTTAETNTPRGRVILCEEKDAMGQPPDVAFRVVPCWPCLRRAFANPGHLCQWKQSETTDPRQDKNHQCRSSELRAVDHNNAVKFQELNKQKHNGEIEDPKTWQEKWDDLKNKLFEDLKQQVRSLGKVVDILNEKLAEQGN
ncbi:hypothetical protein NCS52_01485900 [Fusarium sp. LHS14.1]|nr:hypothetical protein NCS52_01485900 [Fusarium sp. LHS14.1]